MVLHSEVDVLQVVWYLFLFGLAHHSLLLLVNRPLLLLQDMRLARNILQLLDVLLQLPAHVARQQPLFLKVLLLLLHLFLLLQQHLLLPLYLVLPSQLEDLLELLELLQRSHPILVLQLLDYALAACAETQVGYHLVKRHRDEEWKRFILLIVLVLLSLLHLLFNLGHFGFLSQLPHDIREN